MTKPIAEHKRREGIPMNEEEIKEWQQAFIDIDLSINGLKDELKNRKENQKRS